MDIVYLVLGNIIAGSLVHAAMTGGWAIFTYAVIAACDVAFVYNKFRGSKV
jgi:hypothetical protein